MCTRYYRYKQLSFLSVEKRAAVVSRVLSLLDDKRNLETQAGTRDVKPEGGATVTARPGVKRESSTDALDLMSSQMSETASTQSSQSTPCSSQKKRKKKRVGLHQKLVIRSYYSRNWKKLNINLIKYCLISKDFVLDFFAYILLMFYFSQDGR